VNLLKKTHPNIGNNLIGNKISKTKLYFSNVKIILFVLYRHEKHLAFHRKYPEKFAPEGILDPASYQPLPVYFGNVCLRFLPVIFRNLCITF